MKLSTMIPNRSWQTLLNFLDIGRTEVSVFLSSHLLTIYLFVTVDDDKNKNNNIMLCLNFGAGVGWGRVGEVVIMVKL